MLTKKSKIIFIHHGRVPGGAPTSLKNLVTGVSQTKKYACEIACVWPDMLDFFSSIDGVKVSRYPRTGLFTGRVFMGWSHGVSFMKILHLILELLIAPFLIIREINYLKEKQPDFVHLNSSILWMSAIAARFCHIPIVWHIREASDDSRYNVIRIFYTWVIRKIAAGVICIGPQEYIKVGGPKSEKVHLIYNSLSETYFSGLDYCRKAIRKELGLPEHGFLYLSLGGTSFRKGTFQFISSLKNLPEDFSAVLVGDKPEDKNLSSGDLSNYILTLEDYLVKNGLKRNCSWNYTKRISGLIDMSDPKRLFLSGVVDDVKPYIKACDVLIFSGTTPHSARPVYEAWALKKPVIVFDTEVMRQDIDDGVDGVLVHEHTALALANAIEKLRASPGLMESMGRKGYEKAKSRFELRNNTEKIISVYEEISSCENSI